MLFVRVSVAKLTHLTLSSGERRQMELVASVGGRTLDANAKSQIDIGRAII